ncbi:alkylmercury lyase family protein [Streptomyces sp. NBC_01236]|uniref:alkylmercury lyase family protein n=1 Tax=Streptomyces sp. NBC_01236 TaxID=2903789 RepID=UPI002E15F6E6|nr:alkylmercury lyase family protein [Streptomyces sp. NBC_01236]
MPSSADHRTDRDRSGLPATLAGFGAALLVIACCAVPALLAAGILGAVGAWLSNPWVIAAAILLAAAAAILIVRRRARRAACCPHFAAPVETAPSPTSQTPSCKDPAMRITLLAVPDCPNAPVAVERITRALDGRNAHVETVEVTSQEQAARLGMTGSPTILIDGADPFCVSGAEPSVSCRLYRNADGTTAGAPAIEDLRRALGNAAALVDDDCLPLDAAGRAGRGRLAPMAGGLRAVQQAVLRHFVTTGRAPDPADLTAVAAEQGRTAQDVLAELAAEDFLTLDDQGRIRAAYPFSAVPTAHRVRFPDGVEVWSMCAVDALGIPAMLGADAVITSADPVTGETIIVTSTGGHMTWQPSTAVVYVGRRSCTGPAADVACGALKFFTDRRTSRTWAMQYPEYTGRTISQVRAETLGRSTFGTLLAETDSA